MVNTITCPKCKQEFPLSEGVTHEVEERIAASLSEKYKKDLEEAKQRERERIQKETQETYSIELQDLRNFSAASFRLSLRFLPVFSKGAYANKLHIYSIIYMLIELRKEGYRSM